MTSVCARRRGLKRARGREAPIALVTYDPTSLAGECQGRVRCE